MLESLGLGGDGDEVDAITKVEREFGVRLDYRDAPGWRTVGDVFDSLMKALAERAHDPDKVWPRFARAISNETGVDPAQVRSETELLATSVFEAMGKAIRRLLNPDSRT